MICRTCFEKVKTYSPAGTSLLRAEHHLSSDVTCPGTFGPVDDEDTVEREKRRTQAWYGEVPQSADINDYLREKGER